MADAEDPRIGLVIEDRYRIIDRIASGGMGVVYRAERLQLGRTVAVKFLDAANAADETSRGRFEREAKAMSRLSHPHCVSVIDFGVADTPFIVMEYVTGQPLLELIQTKKKVKAERAVAIMKQVMAGLAHAHRHEVVHRDVKPANIMLTDATGTGDFVRILDFGLAKLRGASSLSSANLVVGTPSYMSPEQGTGKVLDARSDIYSAGVVLYELLTGVKPFVGEDAFHTLRMHQSEPVPMLSDIRGTDEMRIALDAIIQKAMAKKPADRFQTALAMGEALSRIQEASRDLRRPRGKRAVSKRDPARATTQVPTPVKSVRPEESEESEEVEDDSGTEALSLPSPSAASALSGFVTTVLVVAILGGVAFFAYRAWQDREAEREAEVSSKATGSPVATTSPKRDAAPATAVVAAAIDAAVREPDAAVDAAPIDAAVVAAAADAAPPPIDAGELVIDEDADAGGTTVALPSGPPKNVDEVLALWAAGEKTRAIRGLQALIRASPKNGYLVRTMGDLNVKRGWYSEALKNYSRAVRLTPRYKRFKSINRAAIDALAYPKVRRRAERFIRFELKRAAIGHLRMAARSHKSPTVRKRAEWLLKRIR